jgi:hypothetical protein
LSVAATAGVRMGEARGAEAARIDDLRGVIRRMAAHFPSARDPGTSAHGHFTGMPTRSHVPARPWRSCAGWITSGWQGWVAMTRVA